MQPQFNLAGKPLSDDDAKRGVMVLGSMTSGRCQVIKSLAHQAAEAGKSLIVYDQTGELTQALYRPGQDVVFDPYRKDFPGWNLFADIDREIDIPLIAQVAVDAPNYGPRVQAYASMVLEEILRKLFRSGDRCREAYIEVLYDSSVEQIEEYLAGTKTGQFFSSLCVRSRRRVWEALRHGVRYLNTITPGGFSLRTWLHYARNGENRLFITSAISNQTRLIPYFRLILTILQRAAVEDAQPTSSPSRYWFFLDNFQSLANLPLMRRFVGEGAVRGVVPIVGVTHPEDLTVSYSVEEAQGIYARLQTKLPLNDGYSYGYDGLPPIRGRLIQAGKQAIPVAFELNDAVP